MVMDKFWGEMGQYNVTYKENAASATYEQEPIELPFKMISKVRTRNCILDGHMSGLG